MGNKAKALLQYQLPLAGATLVGGVIGFALLAFLMPSIYTTRSDNWYTEFLFGVMMLLEGWLVVIGGLNLGLQHSVTRRTILRTTLTAILVLAAVLAILVAAVAPLVRWTGGTFGTLMSPYAASLHGVGGLALTLVARTLLLAGLGMAGAAIGLLLMNASRKQVFWCGCGAYLLLAVLVATVAVGFGLSPVHGVGAVMHQAVGLPAHGAPQPLVLLVWFGLLAALTWLALRQLLRWAEQPTAKKG